MVSTWGTVCVGIISSLSALIACWMANRAAEKRLDKQLELERQREWQKAKLSKAEEIYSALIKFNQYHFSTHMQWVSLARREITVENLISNMKDRPENDAALMTARMGVYFPELLSEFKEVKKFTKPANQCYFAMITGKEISDLERQEFINIIFDSNEKFSLGIESLLKKVSIQVSNI